MTLNKQILIVIAGMLIGAGCGNETQPTVVFDQTTTSGATTQWQFDEVAADSLPDGVTVFSGSWAVRAESDAPSLPQALCQTANATFPALALSEGVYADLIISVSFKPISGNIDQAAGIIFRIQDQNNYYILRANALEANINLYKYVNGQRSPIKEGSGQVPTGQWQTLRLEAKGSALRGYLNDQLVVETTDTTFAAGKVGLWTKADSQTCFDNIQVSEP